MWAFSRNPPCRRRRALLVPLSPPLLAPVPAAPVMGIMGATASTGRGSTGAAAPLDGGPAAAGSNTKAKQGDHRGRAGRLSELQQQPLLLAARPLEPTAIGTDGGADQLARFAGMRGGKEWWATAVMSGGSAPPGTQATAFILGWQ